LIGVTKAIRLLSVSRAGVTTTIPALRRRLLLEPLILLLDVC
jgi:hypothetical protein